jgi:hypothetical protein
MVRRLIVLMSLAAVALLLSDRSGRTQFRLPPAVPLAPMLSPMPEQRFAIVRLRTSASKCVYIQAGTYLALQRPCAVGDSTLRFRYTIAGGGTVLQHVGSGLCLSVSPDDSSVVAGVPCSQAPPLSIQGLSSSPGAFQMRLVTAVIGIIPPQFCFGRESVGSGMRTYSCFDNTIPNYLKDFWLDYVLH